MNRTRRKYLTALVLLLLNGAAMFLFHRFPAFFFPAYRNLSKAWIGLLARLSSFTSIAVWDIASVLLVLLLVVSLVHVVRRHRRFTAWLGNVLLCASVLVTSAVYGWMLNHYAPPLAAELGYEIRLYSQEELQEACEYYLLKAAEYAPAVPRDAEGHLVPHEFDALAKKAGSAYAALGEQDAVLLFTMAHEAGHRLGIASEEEANFAAFLACVNSQETELLYSGYYEAFSYCLSSLYRYNPETALTLYHSHDDDSGVQLVQLDRQDTAAIYRKYESSLQDVSDKINDTYLKTFSQESGIQSYGEVTNDLIAWYLEERN
ncbi:MAG: DUF3810 family protein [Solobacterium sp.]|nr:DUF3810 family protein [Solobacterium sp.]